MHTEGKEKATAPSPDLLASTYKIKWSQATPKVGRTIGKKGQPTLRQLKEWLELDEGSLRACKPAVLPP